MWGALGGDAGSGWRLIVGISISQQLVNTIYSLFPLRTEQKGRFSQLSDICGIDCSNAVCGVKCYHDKNKEEIASSRVSPQAPSPRSCFPLEELLCFVSPAPHPIPSSLSGYRHS